MNTRALLIRKYKTPIISYEVLRHFPVTEHCYELSNKVNVQCAFYVGTVEREVVQCKECHIRMNAGAAPRKVTTNTVRSVRKVEANIVLFVC